MDVERKRATYSRDYFSALLVFFPAPWSFSSSTAKDMSVANVGRDYVRMNDIAFLTTMKNMQ